MLFSVLLIYIGIVFENANFGNTQNFAVRLINSLGTNSNEGRLEIYYSGSWGTICDDSFTNVTARVACASLGYGYMGTVNGNLHGAGIDPIWLDSVSCAGTESGIQRCAHNGWGVHDCTHSEDVSISCVCVNRYFTGPNGTISSPNYPNAYANYLDCYSYITFSSRQTVVITFLALNTESCCDWVTITCTSGNAFTARYSGSQIPAVLTILSCYYVSVYFHTDGSDTKTGFSLTYTVTSGSSVCDNRYFSGPSGTISSLNYPNAYTNNLDCYSYISVSSGQTVLITFLAFNTQSGNDWVSIACESGNAFTSPPYSGSQIPAALIISSCNLVKVYFHTDSSITSRGFSLMYNISSVCNNMYFSGLSGTISSPNYPNAYSNSLNCYNYISVSSGQTVLITFMAFNTQSSNDWVTITCESGKVFSSPRYSGLEFPAVLTISSCYRVNVFFHTDSFVTYTGFSLTYNVTPDNVIGGFTTKPSNAFPRSDKDAPIIFSCTTRTKYLPWWTFSDKGSSNYTITNSTCGVIPSALHSSWFMTETLGPGSCNLIVVAPANNLFVLAGSFVCTDSTLSSARAVFVPINLELKSTTVMNSLAAVTNIIRDEEMRISCNPSFTDRCSRSSRVFTYFLYKGGGFVRMRILRTYWTSEEGNVISSNDTSNTSSYVLVKAPKDGVFPRYTCNIVLDFCSNISDIFSNISDIFSNISDLSGNFPVEMSISTELFEVLYWPTEDSMKITGDNNGQIQTPALLYCNVAANPPATYTWIDESNGNTTYGPTIIVNHGGKYTCNASNIIRGQYYQQSKSITLQVLDDETRQNTELQVSILGALLGVTVLTTIILLAILLSRKCQLKKNTDDGHTLDGNEHKLQHKEVESNVYANDSGNSVDVDESQNDDVDDIYVNVSNEK